MESVSENEIEHLLEDILVMSLRGLCKKYSNLPVGRGQPILDYKISQKVDFKPTKNKSPTRGAYQLIDFRKNYRKT